MPTCQEPNREPLTTDHQGISQANIKLQHSFNVSWVLQGSGVYFIKKQEKQDY